MKTLTVRQPWAELIVSGRRPFEIRTWKTDHKGWMLIHAARKIDEEACRRLELSCAELVLGAIVGKVFVEGCVDFTPQTWEELRPKHLEWGDYRSGLIGWRLNEATKFSHPIPWTGSLGLFEVPDNVLLGAEIQEHQAERQS